LRHFNSIRHKKIQHEETEWNAEEDEPENRKTWKGLEESDISVVAVLLGASSRVVVGIKLEDRFPPSA